MNENKQKTIIVLLIINAILIVYFGVTIKNNSNEKVQMLANQLHNLNNSISNLDSSIPGRIQSVLDEKENLIVTTDYQYVTIDAENNEAVIDVSLKLKSVNANATIYLAYGVRDTGVVQEIALTQKEGLLFGTRIEVDLNKNYQYDVIERVDGGGEALLNTALQNISPYDDFYRNRVFIDGFGSGTSNDEMDLHCSFSVDDFGIDAFSLKSVQLEITYEGHVIDLINVTGLVASDVNNDLRDRYNMAIAAGKIDLGMSLEEYVSMHEYSLENENQTRKYYFYSHTIDFKTDYPELKLDRFKAENLHSKLIITCRDGYQPQW